MSQLLTCANGHRWTPQQDETAQSFSSVCPECGQPGMIASTTLGVEEKAGDAELPPPPRPWPAKIAKVANNLLDSPRDLARQALALPGYEILERIGGGGMGVVYKARHMGLNRLVALKVISPRLVENQELVRRFQREAQAAARLSHPNIITIFDVGEYQGTVFLTMEYLEGETLNDLVRRRGPLPVPLACDYMAQAAQGLHHLVEHGLIHRDLKPSNLFLTNKGVVKILDFGLACWNRIQELQDQETQLTPSGEILGTPDYLAPEQALDPRRVDFRSDIYSLGCTFYHLLVGHPPYAEGTLAQKLLWHQKVEPTPIETLRSDIPPPLAGLLRKMMAKRPEDRFSDPVEVVEALRLFQAPSTSPGLSPASAETIVIPQPKEIRRRHGLAVALTIGSLLTALLLLIGYWNWNNPPQEPNVEKKPTPGKTTTTGKITPVEKKEIVNSLGMVLVQIPAGQFWMGASDEEFALLKEEDERPRHQVVLTKPFFLGQYEVTQAQYEKVMGKNPAFFHTDMGGGPDFPVETVSWDEAVEYCRQLSALPEEVAAGHVYRLPTEAEWEYACRAGTETPFHFGPSLTGELANFDGRKPFPTSLKTGPYLDRTCPVGKYAANKFGLFDMHGNVWEWCADYYDSGYYGVSPLKNPSGPLRRDFQVARGGCWEASAFYCRSAKRGYFPAKEKHRDIGFRVACDIKTTGSPGNGAPPKEVPPIKPPQPIKGLDIDPAVISLTMVVKKRLSPATAEIQIVGLIKNIGTQDFKSAKGQQVIRLYEHLSGVKPKIVLERVFTTLQSGRQNTYLWSRQWDSAMENPPDYSFQIDYDPGIFMDGNPDNDDINQKNNSKTLSGKTITDTVRSVLGQKLMDGQL